MLNKLIAEYYVIDNLNNKKIFHGTGSIDDDISNAIQSKENKLIIFNRIFNNFQRVLNSSAEILVIFNKIDAVQTYGKDGKASFYIDVVYSLGKRILENKTLTLDKPLSTLLKNCYDYLIKWDAAETARSIDDNLGGNKNVDKLFELTE